MCCNHITTLGKPRTVQRPLQISLSVLLWFDDINNSLTHFDSLINESRCIKGKTVIQLLESNSISNYSKIGLLVKIQIYLIPYTVKLNYCETLVLLWSTTPQKRSKIVIAF